MAERWLPVQGHEMSKKLCELIGLDPRNVCEITIYAAIGQLATVKVVQYVDSDKTNQVETCTYRLQRMS